MCDGGDVLMGTEVGLSPPTATADSAMLPPTIFVMAVGTSEAEGSGEYDRFFPTEGHFVCRGCRNPLFSAAAKYKRGCGWPSFDRCYKDAIRLQMDLSGGMRRRELVCARRSRCRLKRAPPQGGTHERSSRRRVFDW